MLIYYYVHMNVHIIIYVHRMQTQTAANKLSPVRLLHHIIRTEGMSNIYKGVGPSLLSLSIVITFSFTSYSYFRTNLFHGTDGWDYRNAFSGMMGAPLFGIVTTPEIFIKTQMQLDNVQAERKRISIDNNNSNGQQQQQRQRIQQPQQKLQLSGRFTSSFQCAKTLVQSHGPRILYTGHFINTIREAAFVGTYFFCYEGYKTEFQKLLASIENRISSSNNANNRQESSHWSTTFAIPMAGGCAGASAWALTFPLDCVRAGVQGQHISLSSTVQLQKQGSIETLKHLIKTKGFTGLYAGVSPSIARAFIVSGTRFSAYEGALWLCRWSGLTSSNRSAQYNDEGPGAYDD